MLADGCDQLLELLPEKPVESLDLVLPELPQLWITAGFSIVLEAGNLIDDLVDQRLALRHGCQARIRWMQAAINAASILSFLARCR